MKDQPLKFPAPDPGASSRPMRQMMLAIVLLLMTHAAPGAELSQQERVELLTQLRSMREKYPALQAEFVEERTTHLLTHPIVSEGTVFFEVPDKFRREIRGQVPVSA